MIRKLIVTVNSTIKWSNSWSNKNLLVLATDHLGLNQILDTDTNKKL